MKRILKKSWIPVLVLVFCMTSFMPVSVVKADETYGEEAYQYLRELTDNYGYRVNNKEVSPDQDNKVAAGEWIDQIMTGFGYTAKVYTNENDMSRENGNFVKSYCYFKQGTSNKRVVIGAHYDSVDTYGTEDNGTGVCALLEIAHKLKSVTTPLSVEFCFWDGEEYLGFAGSFHYIWNKIGEGDLQNILLYINLDCIGSGDKIFVCGGDYENDVLVREWGYNMANATAEALNIEVTSLPEDLELFRSPVMTADSDQFFFNDQKIPYVYFLTSAVKDSTGKVFLQTNPFRFRSADPRIKKTSRSLTGQTIHSDYDNLDVLEGFFPGRILEHMSQVEKIVISMVKNLNTNSASVYSNPNTNVTIPTETEASSTAAPTVVTTEAPETDPSEETEEESAEESSETEEETEPAESSTAAPIETQKPTESNQVTPEPTDPSAKDPNRPLSVFEIIAIVFAILLVGVWFVAFLHFLTLRPYKKRKRRRK